MLAKRGQTFIAEITPKTARLLRQGDNERQATEIIAPKPYAAHSGPARIEFTNVDYRVTLRIDDVDVLQTNEQQYHPDMQQLIESYEQGRSAVRNGTVSPPAVRIAAANQRAQVSHLSLWRDVYYLNLRQDRGQFLGSPDSIMRLGSDEYFVLGDNSQISGDGRYWTEPIDLPYEHLKTDAGKVPARFMLGKAFFVYWPAGYRPMESAPAIAPDFGDMRFIH
jgi:hypothetical protein